VVGAGPAGLSCAHRLALYGHQVTVFEARKKAGGLNEYGLAAYKMLDERAAREVDFIFGIGGITPDPC
jgi:glutamate synthase (NADPH/NADH) small chain